MESRSPDYNPAFMDAYADLIAGQIYPPDTQCDAVQGAGSYLCRVIIVFWDTNYVGMTSY